MRCEDFPCCGHEAGDCPDPDADARGELPFRCVECGGRIKKGTECHNAPSMHAGCARRYAASQYDDYPEDY